MGFISSDFKGHIVGELTGSLFGLINGMLFKVACFSTAAKTVFIDQFKCITVSRAVQVNDAAHAIKQTQPHLILDLSGATRGARPELLANKLAPVQVSYLGTLVPSGAHYIQYHLTDKVILAPSIHTSISEKAVLLPHVYQVNDHKQKYAAALEPESLIEHRGLTLLNPSGNRPAKLEPTIFSVWMNVLRRNVLAYILLTGLALLAANYLR